MGLGIDCAVATLGASSGGTVALGNVSGLDISAKRGGLSIVALVGGFAGARAIIVGLGEVMVGNSVVCCVISLTSVKSGRFSIVGGFTGATAIIAGSGEVRVRGSVVRDTISRTSVKSGRFSIAGGFSGAAAIIAGSCTVVNGGCSDSSMIANGSTAGTTEDDAAGGEMSVGTAAGVSAMFGSLTTVRAICGGSFGSSGRY